MAVTVFADDAGISNVAGHYPKEIVRVNDANPERTHRPGPRPCLRRTVQLSRFAQTARTLRDLDLSATTSYNDMAEIEAGLIRLE